MVQNESQLFRYYADISYDFYEIVYPNLTVYIIQYGTVNNLTVINIPQIGLPTVSDRDFLSMIGIGTHESLTHYWINVEPPSTTLAQH